MVLSESLSLVAELAVALAGFASLVTVIGRRSRDDAAIDATALRGMLEASLIAAAFALLPFVPFYAGLSQAITWRLCGGPFAVVGGLYGFLVVRRLSRIPNYLGRSRAFFGPGSTSWLAVSFGLMASAWISLVAAALGWLPKPEVA